MRLLIEEYKYNADDVRDVLQDIQELEDIEGYVRINYVGYFYCTHKNVQDCVFILPKVLLEVVEDGYGVACERVFGKYRPEEIINIDKNNDLTPKEREFIYEFAVWIYRAIVVFKSDKGNDTSIVYQKQIAQLGYGQRRFANTYLEVILELMRFNKENQNFFMFVLRNLHSGLNKINWTRTIAHSPAIVQDNNPIYLNPINKKRQINFDEELLVIYFSILNYINEHYGFKAKINCNFELIKGAQFERYKNGYGRVRLQQIKYKYFSDKALRLWELCMAFFDMAKKVVVDVSHKEYLLVQNFNIVFEAIIDELIGDKNIPRGLKKQEDGKRVDHMYTYQGLTTYEEDKPIYYIGDSKYYKRGNEMGTESVYKQFTYARNVIQWNLDLFMSEDKSDEDLIVDRKNYGHVSKLRDDVTEGYNIIPNFFISATLPKDLSYGSDGIRETEKKSTSFTSSQFKNRLFDRDTLLVCHYDVNFLYVVSLYAKESVSQKNNWKGKVRKLFREKIQSILQKNYNFYAMEARPDVNAEHYIHENFKDVLGKIFTPYGNKEIYSLALDKDEQYKKENEELLAELKKYFYVEGCDLGEDPNVKIGKAIAEGGEQILSDNKNVLIAKVRNKQQLKWIQGTHQYNIPLDKVKANSDLMNVQFILMYVDGHPEKVWMYYVLKQNLQVLTQGDIEKEAKDYVVDGKCYEPGSIAYLVWHISKNELSVTKDKRCDLEKIFPSNQREKAYVLRTYQDVLGTFE